jgi:acyl carrier protein
MLVELVMANEDEFEMEIEDQGCESNRYCSGRSKLY